MIIHQKSSQKWLALCWWFGWEFDWDCLLFTSVWLAAENWNILISIDLTLQIFSSNCMNFTFVSEYSQLLSFNTVDRIRMWISHGFWFFTPELLKTVVYSCLELSWLLKLNWEFDEAWLNIIEMRDVWWCRVSADVVVVVMMLMRISNCYSQLLRHHDFNTNWVLVLRALKIQNFFEVFLFLRREITADGTRSKIRWVHF